MAFGGVARVVVVGTAPETSVSVHFFPHTPYYFGALPARYGNKTDSEPRDCLPRRLLVSPTLLENDCYEQGISTLSTSQETRRVRFQRGIFQL